MDESALDGTDSRLKVATTDDQVTEVLARVGEPRLLGVGLELGVLLVCETSSGYLGPSHNL